MIVRNEQLSVLRFLKARRGGAVSKPQVLQEESKSHLREKGSHSSQRLKCSPVMWLTALSATSPRQVEKQDRAIPHLNAITERLTLTKQAVEAERCPVTWLTTVLCHFPKRLKHKMREGPSCFLPRSHL